MTSTIIPQRRAIVAALPPHLRRGRHALARHPRRLELINRRVARFYAERSRPAHLDLVRARVTRWSAIAIVIALYLGITLGAVLG